MTRILPSDHEFIRRTLRDFRVVEDGQRWIARLKGEGKFRSSVFSEFKPNVLVELIPVAEWNRPSLPFRWIAALRLPYLAISILPLLLVLCARIAQGPVPFLITFLVFASVALIHLGCNLWSDYEDHVRGVDSPGQSGGSGVIQKLWIPAVHLRNAAAVLFLAGCAFGVVLLSQLPPELVGQRLLWLALLGALGAASYSGWPFHYKYLGLGEPVVFLLAGPLVTAGAAALYFPNLHDLFHFALLSLPLSFLVTLRLHAGNMQRIPFDTIAKVLTIARNCGFRWSKHAYLFLSIAPFFTVSIFLAMKFLALGSAIVFLSAPIVFFALPHLRDAKGPLDPSCTELRSDAAKLHWAFGLLYCASLFLFR